MVVPFESFRTHDKLLSHRGRGFGYPEASLEAIRLAMTSGVRYLELDTRVDTDCILRCHHHARVLTSTGSCLLRDIPKDSADALGIARLDQVLGLVAEVIERDQWLCLDIKDYGFETDHIRLIEDYGLSSNTIFISWIPQTLKRLNELSETYPLILSHINLQFIGVGAKLLERLFDRREIRLFDYILMGPKSMLRPLAHKVGFQHGLIGANLPDSYIQMLRNSGGGICVPCYCLCEKLDTWCETHRLRQWVFTVNDNIQYRRLIARKAIDVVFSDDPRSVASTNHPTGGRDND
jgi:glycerophosphoryl diester phosphodiesterase